MVVTGLLWMVVTGLLWMVVTGLLWMVVTVMRTCLRTSALIKAKGGQTICLLRKRSPNTSTSYTSRQNGSIHMIQMMLLAVGCSVIIRSSG
jgi:hypothetical protein